MTTQKRAPQVCDVSQATRYRKVLVALDRADNAAAIFANALNLARACGGELLAFHCISYLPDSHDLLAAGTGLGLYAPEAIYYPTQIAQETLDEITGWLGNWQRKAGNCAVPCAFEHRVGDPGREICVAARNWDADLIVVGRRGRSGLTEMVLGSVSNYVMHHAHCDVLVVQGRDEESEN